MSKHRELLYGHPVPQSFFDALQEFVGTLAPNFALALAPGSQNQVQVVAGPDNFQVGIGIEGLWRYNTSTVTVAVTGAAGTYDLHVTCGENDFAVNQDPPPPEIDSTNYSFALASVAAGGTPTGVAHTRKVGEALFDGSRVLMLRNLVSGIDGSQLWQPGMIQLSAAPQPPIGWLRCDGTAVSRTDYAALFAALGGTASPWGQGNGSTTFNVPDLRSRVPVGFGAGAGLTSRTLAAAGGEENHALAVAEMPSHNHNGATGAGTSGAWAGSTGGGTSGGWSGATGNQNALHNHGVAGYGAFVTADASLQAAAVWNNPQAGHSFGVYANAVARVGTTNTESAYHVHAIPNHGHSIPALAIPSHTHSVPALAIAAQGSSGAHNNMPPFVACNFFVKT